MPRLTRLYGYQVTLTQVTENDLEMLRNWRNLPEVKQYMLSQQNISREQQQAWFNKLEKSDKEQHFVITYKNTPIGSANIKVHTGDSLQQAVAIEPGLYIADNNYRNNILAFAPTLLLNDYCFEQLGAKYLLAVVKQDNQAALNYNKKLGYQVVNQDELVTIRLTAQDYQRHSKGLKQLLDRPKRG